APHTDQVPGPAEPGVRRDRVGQPGVAAVHPQDDGEHQHDPQRHHDRDVVRQQGGELRDGEHEDQVEEELEGADARGRHDRNRRGIRPPRCHGASVSAVSAGTGYGSRRVNASGPGPWSRNWSSRADASSMVGMCPAGTHHSTEYGWSATWNHSRRRRNGSTCPVLKTNSRNVSTDSHTVRFTMTSGPNGRRAVASAPSESTRRHTKPGAASAIALTLGSAATKSASRGLSSGSMS